MQLKIAGFNIVDCQYCSFATGYDSFEQEGEIIPENYVKNLKSPLQNWDTRLRAGYNNGSFYSVIAKIR